MKHRFTWSRFLIKDQGRCTLSYTLVTSGAMSANEPPRHTPPRPLKSPNYVAVHGPSVRYFRLERDMSGRELAHQVGVQPPYISRIEHGSARRVSVTVFRKLRAALGIPHTHRQMLMASPYGEPDPEPHGAAA